MSWYRETIKHMSGFYDNIGISTNEKPDLDSLSSCELKIISEEILKSLRDIDINRKEMNMNSQKITSLLPWIPVIGIAVYIQYLSNGVQVISDKRLPLFGLYHISLLVAGISGYIFFSA
jgi:hypothetical protein